MSAPFVNRRVKITGVGAKPELNNQEGRATGYNAESMRYTVLLDSGSTVALKPSNLIPVGPSDEDSGARAGSGFGGMPGLPDMSRFFAMLPETLRAKLLRGELPTMEDLRMLLPPGITSTHVAGVAGLILVTMFKFGIFKTFLLYGLIFSLLYLGYAPFKHAGGGVAGSKAALRGIGRNVSDIVFSQTRKTLSPNMSLGAVAVVVVAVLYFVLIYGDGSSPAAAYAYSPSTDAGLSAEEAYDLGFQDATLNKPHNWLHHSHITGSSSSIPPDTYYSPPTPSGGLGSLFGGLSLSKLFTIAILGRQIYGLGAAPDGSGFDVNLGIANFMNQGTMQKVFMGLMVLRLFGMSPI